MQNTSELYQRILMDDHWYESSITIGDIGYLVDERGNRLVFGMSEGTNDIIPVDDGGPDNGFREDSLISVRTQQELFKSGTPTIGSAIAGEIDLEMIAPLGKIPKRARIGVYNRITNGNETSEWIKNGTYYIDTRQMTADDRGFDVFTVHGYDAMVLADADYPSVDGVTYPMLDIDMVRLIADHMRPSPNSQSGIQVDQRTIDNMVHGYRFNWPVGYTMREVLNFIASSYGGNFMITTTGELRLILLNEIPKETRVLVDEGGFQLVFGIDEEDGTPVHILV